MKDMRRYGVVGVVKQQKFDRLRPVGEDTKIDALLLRQRTERVSISRLNVGGHFSSSLIPNPGSRSLERSRVT